MKKVLVILLIFCFFNSCSKYDIPKCDFKDATQDLLWLKGEIDKREANPSESMRYCYISQATLKRKTVFIFGDCNPAINKVTFVYTCEGELIKNTDGENIVVGAVDLKDERIIWQPDDFGCSVNVETRN